MLSMAILGTASHLEGETRTTRELIEESIPSADPDELAGKIGIHERRFASSPPSVMAARALRAACEDAGLEPSDLRRIIYVSSVGGDQQVPATGNNVLRELGLASTCDAFDLNNACMGFLTAIDLAARSVVTGLGPVGVVVVERPSHFITPDYYRSYLIFGDAAAAAIIGPGGDGDGGLLGTHLSNDPSYPGSVILPMAGFRKDHFVFQASNKAMTGIALAALKRAADDVLEQAGMTIADVEWVLPHQPNGRMLDRALEALGVAREQTVRVVDTIGSVGAASIPFSLARLMRERDVKPGDRILMVGVGTGVAYGAMLYQVPSC